MSVPKEPNFFCDDSRYRLGWNWYESCFPGAERAQAVGEASVLYSQQHVYPEAASRIAAALPDARLLYVVRHPFDRVESGWAEWRKHDPKALPFNEAVVRYRRFFQATCYWSQLSAFRERFPDDQIKVVFLEELLAAPDAVMAEIQRFIGVSPVDGLWQQTTRRNVTRGSRVPRDLPDRIPAQFTSQAVRSRLPSPFRQLLGWATTESPPRIVWDPGTARAAQEILEPDIGTFLAATGKSPNYWRLSADPAQRHPRLIASA
jgi:hypothetical protein